MYCVEIIGLVVCFTSMIIIARQGNKKEAAEIDEVDDSMEENSLSRFTAGILFGFTSSWLYAFCSVFNRRLFTVTVEIVMFYHGITGMLFAILVIVIQVMVQGDGISLFTHDLS